MAETHISLLAPGLSIGLPTRLANQGWVDSACLLGVSWLSLPLCPWGIQKLLNGYSRVSQIRLADPCQNDLSNMQNLILSPMIPSAKVPPHVAQKKSELSSVQAYTCSPQGTFTPQSQGIPPKAPHFPDGTGHRSDQFRNLDSLWSPSCACLFSC